MDTQLTLKIGRTYRHRSPLLGDPVKIIGFSKEPERPYQGDDGCTYRADGGFFPGPDTTSAYDLEEEVPVPVVSATTVPFHEETFFHGDPKFLRLRGTLLRAYLQVAEGKGAARHGSGKAWPEQPMFKIAEIVGTGFHLGQALKKIEESTRLDDEAAVKELLGAISYIAAAIESIEEGHR